MSNEQFGFSFEGDRLNTQRGGTVRAGDYSEPQRERKPEDKKKKKSDLVKRLKRWTISGTIDAPFLIIVIVLLCIGLVMMFSASYPYGYYKYNDSLYFIKRQAVFAVIGVAAMLVASRFNYRKLNGGLAFFLYVFTVFLLIGTFIKNTLKPIPGKEDFKRWLNIGPIRFQPSEIAKFALIVFLAYSTARLYGLIQTKNGLNIGFLNTVDRKFTSKIRAGFYKNASTSSFAITVWYLFLIGLICFLIVIEKHLSCTILVFLMGMSMMWLAGVKKGYFAVIAVFVAFVAVIVIMNPEILSKYAGDRIVAWLDKSYQPRGARWQTNQSLRAIASGGPFGLGLGNSIQKHMFVSEPQNDFIFAIVCEELGFVGASAIVCLFAALVWRAFKIAEKAKDIFGSTLAMGLALQVGIQVLLNIAVVTDTIPNTGISLPFFSYGGTSLLMLLGEMGIILSVSRNSTINKA